MHTLYYLLFGVIVVGSFCTYIEQKCRRPQRQMQNNHIIRVSANSSENFDYIYISGKSREKQTKQQASKKVRNKRKPQQQIGDCTLYTLRTCIIMKINSMMTMTTILYICTLVLGHFTFAIHKKKKLENIA